MYKLQFLLKQHTPMIHFQHDEAGATLRASDLKPRFDTFLKNELERIDKQLYQANVSIIERISVKTQRSPYSLQVTAMGEPQYYLFASGVKAEKMEQNAREVQSALQLANLKGISPSPFFANNDKIGNAEKINEVRIGVLHPEGVELTFFCNEENHKEILDLIEKSLPYFLSCVNFGTRQNKGFGNFLPQNLDKKTLDKAIKAFYPRVIEIEIKDEELSKIFQQVDSLYKKIKCLMEQSGAKSFIRDFFKDDYGIEWEKKIVKEELIDKNHCGNLDESNHPALKNIRYVRALLGLAELYDYAQYAKQKRYDKVKEKVKIEDPINGEKKIDRFASPITFKTFAGKLYILISEIPKEILDHSFVFFTGNDFKNASNKITIKTPKNIDWESFCDYIENKIK